MFKINPEHAIRYQYCMCIGSFLNFSYNEGLILETSMDYYWIWTGWLPQKHFLMAWGNCSSSVSPLFKFTQTTKNKPFSGTATHLLRAGFIKTTSIPKSGSQISMDSVLPIFPAGTLPGLPCLVPFPWKRRVPCWNILTPSSHPLPWEASTKILTPTSLWLSESFPQSVPDAPQRGISSFVLSWFY